MKRSNQLGIDVSHLAVSFPDLKRLESELADRFGQQSWHCSAEFALTQS